MSGPLRAANYQSRHSGATRWRRARNPFGHVFSHEMDSGLAAEPVIGPRFARDPLARPEMTRENGPRRIARKETDLPDRQNNRRTRKPVHPFAKYSASRLPQIKLTVSAVPAHTRGVSRSSRTLGNGMRWTRQRQAHFFARDVMLRRTAKSCGPGAPMQALRSQRRSRVLRATVATKHGHRGEREGNR
jgi:hypothetical protein